jgi:hypothetical protein
LYVVVDQVRGAGVAVRQLRGVARWRLVALVAGLLALTVKVTVAIRTSGTTDVLLWQSFADSVRLNGPVGIYGHEFALPYNHAPLSGWLLVLINWTTDHIGGSLPLLIRLPASVADVVTGLVVFELLLRTGRTARAAATAATLVVLSPILLIISGFHGNTDALFVMFALLAGYLVVARGWCGWAGAALGVALSVKLVPVVLVPTLAVLVLRSGRWGWARFAGGLVAVMGPLWLPVVLTRWAPFSRDVLGYAGVPLRQWGPVQFLRTLGAPSSVEELIAGPGRFLILALCAGLPAWLAWRRRDAAIPAIGLSLVLFLLLTPAFGMQYLAWGLAASYLVGPWVGSAYNLFGSVFAVAVYDYWNLAPPWRWDLAPGKPMRTVDLVLQVPAWLALAAVAVTGLRGLRRPALRVPAQPAGWPSPPLDGPTVDTPLVTGRHRA